MDINYVTVGLVLVFAITILSGAFRDFSKEKMHYSIASLVNSIEILFALFISIYLTKKIFFENQAGFFKQVYSFIPQTLKSTLYGRDILTYILIVPLILLIIMTLLRLITNPLYKSIVVPWSNGLYSFLDSYGDYVKRTFGAIWQLPRAAYLVFVAAIFLNFYAYYFPSSQLSQYMSESLPYQAIYKNAIYPLLSSNMAKKFPVLIGDSFKEMGMVIPGDRNSTREMQERIRQQLAKRNIKVVEYFNGVTLEEAIRSTPEIDRMAKRIVGNENNSRKKAKLLYNWISSNIEYDYDKAKQISENSKGASSGAEVAFRTRKGICFDYSCLYIAMCRSAGIKVRLVTGLAYSGVSWGDHAWNQVFLSEEKTWINVDTTFGSAANYLDKKDFNVDHRYANIEGEW